MNIDVELMKKRTRTRPTTTTHKSNKVVKLDSFFFRNEVKITEQVRKIKYYHIWFDILKKYSLLKIGEMEERRLYQHEIQINAFLCEYPSNETRCDLFDFLSNLPSDKLVIFHLFDSFKHLLNSIDMLSLNNLAFLSISPEDIVIGEHLKPLLRNFEKCCFLDQMNQSCQESEYNPFECKVICYLTKNMCASLSIANIEEICNGTSSECANYLRKFVNEPTSDIIKELSSYSASWGKCSLALVYLQLIHELFVDFSLKYKFIHEFINILHQMTRIVDRLSDTQEIQTRIKSIDFTSFS
jgi:hypothetical protein